MSLMQIDPEPNRGILISIQTLTPTPHEEMKTASVRTALLVTVLGAWD